MSTARSHPWSTARCLSPADDASSAASRCLPQLPVPAAGREHRTAVTAAEFKEWLKQFDADRDGRINRRELREAIRRRGAWFPGVRAWRVVRRADRDRNGYVDEGEMEDLLEFAEKELGFLISRDPPSTRWS